MEFNKLRCEIAKLKQKIPDFINNNDNDVHNNIVHVLDALRNDTEQTEYNLEQLRRKNFNCSKLLKDLMERRLNELSMKVQNTHDESVSELSDLNHKLEKCKEKNNYLNHSSRILRIANNKIDIEINNIRKYCPLIKDKVILEGEKIKKIELAISSTKNDVKATLESVEQHKHELERFIDMVDNERKEILNDLAATEQRLRDKINKHRELCDLADTLKEETEKAITEKREAEELAGKLEHIYEELVNEHETLKTVFASEKQKLSNVEAEHSQISGMVKKLSRTLNTRMYGRFDREIKEQKNEVQKQTTITTDQENLRDNLASDIDTKNIRIDCLKQSIEEAIEKFNGYRERQQSIENLFKKLYEDFRKISKERSEVKAILEKEQKEFEQQESKLRGKLDRIQSEVEQEVVTRTNIMAQMRSDIAELQKAKDEAIEKRASLVLMAETAEKQMEAKAFELSEIEQKLLEKKDENKNLQNELDSRKNAWAVEKKLLENKLKNLTTESDEAQNRAFSLSKKFTQMKSDIDDMEINKKQLIINLNAAVRSKINNQRELIALEKKLHEVRKEYISKEKTFNQVRSTTAAELKRQVEHSNEHFELMNDRQSVLKKLSNDLTNELNTNAQLSFDFKDTQGQKFSLDSNFHELTINNSINTILLNNMNQLLDWLQRVECQNSLNWNRDKKLTEITFVNACKNLIYNVEKIKVFQDFV